MKQSLLIAIILVTLILPTSGVSASGMESPWVKETITLANKERSDRGIGTLSENASLDKAAAMKLADMEKNGYFAHTSPQGLTPWSFMDSAGYGYRYAGENLAIHFTDPESEHSAWMKSEKHCQNILDPRYRETGIAVKKIFFEGRETMLVVEMFGTLPGQEVATSLTKEDTLAMCRGEVGSVSGVAVEQASGTPSPTGRIALLSSPLFSDIGEFGMELVAVGKDRYGVAELVAAAVLALAQVAAVILYTRLLLARETREGVYLS
ncbi:MAG TPA: CAP domain-containing protein [Candidatus Fimivivens sp.]|nr:CAP domain-containing protein [Candidatus Fimivivens sp.]